MALAAGISANISMLRRKTTHTCLHYLETVLLRLADLLKLLADHGLYRIFLPVYSEYQESREGKAHEYLVKGIVALKKHPALVKPYQESGLASAFTGTALSSNSPCERIC